MLSVNGRVISYEQSTQGFWAILHCLDQLHSVYPWGSIDRPIERTRGTRVPDFWGMVQSGNGSRHLF